MVAVYAFVAWLILQVAETVLEPLGFPGWVMQAIVMAAIAGFPLSFLLAWIIDVRPEGLIFDLPLWGGDSEQPRAQRGTDVLFALVLIVLVSGGTYYVIDKFLPDLQDDSAEVALEAPAKSIAVLAFENFGPESETDYFGAGLAEEILNLLAGIDELKVAARTSSFQFRGEALDIRDIARRLNVRHVLEGSARVANERIRVTAQLINGADGFHSFSEVYERPMDDVFAIQIEIAEAVVGELKVALSIESADVLRDTTTRNTDAYVLYLQGRGRLRSSLDADVMRAAIGLFEKALALDADFAKAWAGLCEAQLRLYEITASEEVFAKAESACQKAQEKSTGADVDMHIALGKLYRSRGTLEQAQTQIENALLIDPIAVDAIIELGEIREARQDIAGAESHYQRAIELKPNYWRAYEALAAFQFRALRYAEAVDNYQTAIDLAPLAASLHSALGATYWMLGDMDKARAGYDESLRLKPSVLGYTNLGLKHYYAGQFEMAVEMQLEAAKLANDNNEIWGRLAESYRFVPGSEALADEAYVRAAQLAEEFLRVNPQDWYTVGLLGLYYAHLGRDAEAMSKTEQAVTMSDGSPDALFFRALAALQLGQRDHAIALLAKTIEADAYFQQFLDTDPDLRQLAGDEGFEALRSKPAH